LAGAGVTLLIEPAANFGIRDFDTHHHEEAAVVAYALDNIR
jgi:hypothetical protein